MRSRVNSATGAMDSAILSFRPPSPSCSEFLAKFCACGGRLPWGPLRCGLRRTRPTLRAALGSGERGDEPNGDNPCKNGVGPEAAKSPALFVPKKRTAIFDVDPKDLRVRGDDDDAEGPPNPLQTNGKEKALLEEKRKVYDADARLPKRLRRLVSSIVGFVTPREHGDIRDVILVCLSFSVMVYIAQRMVIAYMTLFVFPNHF